MRIAPPRSAALALRCATVVAAAVVACARSPEPAVVADAAASTDSTSTFEAVYYGGRARRDPRSPIDGDPRLLRVIVGAGATRRVLSGVDFTTTRYASPHSAELSVPGRGELPVRVALMTPAGDTLAVAQVLFALQPGWRYGVSIHIGRERPVGICVAQVVAVPLDHEADQPDSLFVGSAGIPRNAVC